MASSQHQYTPLPEYDLINSEKPQTDLRLGGAKKRTFTTSLVIKGIAVLAVFLSFFAAVNLVITRTVTEPTEDKQKQPLGGPKEWEEIVSKATGDEYLIGVGKADITGYVR